MKLSVAPESTRIFCWSLCERCGKKLVFSYCEGTYCTQIGNISHKALSPRPSGLSVLKILFHEHLLYDGVLYIVLGIGDESNNVLGCGLLFDQERVSRFWGQHFGGGGLNGFFLGVFFLQISSCLGGFVRTTTAKVPLFFAPKASSFLSEFLSFLIINRWMHVGGASFNSSRCSVHCVIPLF